MSAVASKSVPLTGASDPDIAVEQLGDEVLVQMPRPTSPHHQLAIIWRLRQIWSAAQGPSPRFVLDLSALDDIPHPLMSVVMALEQDLRNKGGRLRITGVRTGRVRIPDDGTLSGSCDPLQKVQAKPTSPQAAAGAKTPSNHEQAGGEAGQKEIEMNEQTCIGDFEQRLLDHVEMLYAVALKLTENPWDAERITRITMTQAWDWRNQPKEKHSLKTELLKLLRRTFLSHCQLVDLHEALWSRQLADDASANGKMHSRTQTVEFAHAL